MPCGSGCLLPSLRMLAGVAYFGGVAVGAYVSPIGMVNIAVRFVPKRAVPTWWVCIPVPLLYPWKCLLVCHQHLWCCVRIQLPQVLLNRPLRHALVYFVPLPKIKRYVITYIYFFFTWNHRTSYVKLCRTVGCVHTAGRARIFLFGNNVLQPAHGNLIIALFIFATHREIGFPQVFLCYRCYDLDYSTIQPCILIFVFCLEESPLDILQFLVW